MSSDPNSFEYLFSPVDWIKVLHLASLFGFDPANLEDDEPITAEEIGAIALAVEESLDDIPNHNASGGKKAHQMSPLEWFSGARKEKLCDFVKYCREAEILDR
jgi:hypothetical protein